MTRLYPKNIQNKVFLSRLLEYYLARLEQSDLGLTLYNLSWDTGIPQPVIRRMAALYRTPADDGVITVNDFHILFANIMVHYPTVTFWRDNNGEVHLAV